MKLLLDTHVWVWALEKPRNIGLKVRREMERNAEELYLSPVSIWEAGNLSRKGRLVLDTEFLYWLHAAYEILPIHEAPLTFAIAEFAARIHLPQSDPGDVFIAATAATLNLTLVTADEQLLACKWLTTLAAH